MKEIVSPSPFALPASDHVLSPITGWTREHWESVADRWLGHIRDYSSEHKGAPRLPGRVTRDGERREGMETIGRSLLMAAPRIQGAQGKDPLELASWYREALLAGTSLDGPESWPRGVMCKSPLLGVTNSIVEAANIAFSLYISRDWLWETFSADEKKQIADWLRHHARLEVWGNNWQLFPAMAEGFLRSVGEDVSGCIGARNVARVESWYLGDGWYTDGPEHSIDYYNAWAIHPYLWAWYDMTDAWDSYEGKRYKERLHAFVDSYSLMFAKDGAVLHVGRSLAYRTAVLAAAWCAEMAGVNPLTPGQTRRLASGVLANFTAKGVGVDGPPSLGWYDEHLGGCQDYSGFGSPYLAGIGFLGLALPADHPVWTATEEAQPTDGPDFSRSLPDLNWILDSAGGLVRLSNHGSDHCGLPVGNDVDPDDMHYAKFSYSTHTGPGTNQAWEENIDGHLALVTADGVASRRTTLRAARTVGNISGSIHIPQKDRKTLPGTAVITVSMTHGIHELRAHLVHGGSGYTIREGSHAVAGATAPAANVVTESETGPAAWARNEENVSAGVVGIHGWESAHTAAYEGCNSLGEFSAVPYLQASGQEAPSLYLALHTLSREAEGQTPVGDLVQVTVAGTQVTARWTDGTTHEVDLESFIPWDEKLGK